MSKALPMAILCAATAFAGVAGAATRTTAQVHPASKSVHAVATTSVTRTSTRIAPARTAPVKLAATRPMPAARPAPAGRLVSARLANGKTVTYNCALPGNATKKACK